MTIALVVSTTDLDKVMPLGYSFSLSGISGSFSSNSPRTQSQSLCGSSQKALSRRSSCNFGDPSSARGATRCSPGLMSCLNGEEKDQALSVNSGQPESLEDLFFAEAVAFEVLKYKQADSVVHVPCQAEQGVAVSYTSVSVIGLMRSVHVVDILLPFLWT